MLGLGLAQPRPLSLRPPQPPGARKGEVPSRAHGGCPFGRCPQRLEQSSTVWHSHCRRPDYFLEQYTASVSTVFREREHTPRGDSLYKEESPEVHTPGKKRVLQKVRDRSRMQVTIKRKSQSQALPSRRVGAREASTNQADRNKSIKTINESKEHQQTVQQSCTADRLESQVRWSEVPTPKRLRGLKPRTVNYGQECHVSDDREIPQVVDRKMRHLKVQSSRIPRRRRKMRESSNVGIANSKVSRKVTA